MENPFNTLEYLVYICTIAINEGLNVVYVWSVRGVTSYDSFNPVNIKCNKLFVPREEKNPENKSNIIVTYNL